MLHNVLLTRAEHFNQAIMLRLIVVFTLWKRSFAKCSGGRSGGTEGKRCSILKSSTSVHKLKLTYLWRTAETWLYFVALFFHDEALRWSSLALMLPSLQHEELLYKEQVTVGNLLKNNNWMLQNYCCQFNAKIRLINCTSNQSVKKLTKLIMSGHEQ